MTDRSPAFTFIDNPFLSLGKLCDDNINSIPMLFSLNDPLTDDSLSNCDAISRTSSSSPLSPNDDEFIHEEFHVGPLEPLSGMPSVHDATPHTTSGQYTSTNKLKKSIKPTNKSGSNSSRTITTLRNKNSKKQTDITNITETKDMGPLPTLSPSSSSDDLASLADPADITSLPTGDGDIDTKRKRLARKAALARESRKRKKCRLAEMESEVDRLREELHRVRMSRGLPSPSDDSRSPCSSPTPMYHSHHMSTSPCFSMSSSSSPMTVNDEGVPMIKLESPSSPMSPYSSPEVAVTCAEPAPAVSLISLVTPEAPVAGVASVVSSSLTSVDDGEQAALALAMQQIIAAGSIAQAAATNLAAMVTPTGDGGVTTTGDVTATALQVGAANAQLESHIESLLAICERKNQAAEAHLSSLDKLLVPCMPLRFLEWFLTQKESFYCDSGLWHTLCNQILCLSTDQMVLLLALRRDMLAQRTVETELRLTAAGLCASSGTNGTTPVMTMSSTISLQQVYASLSSLSRLHMVNAHRNLSSLRSILSALQLAKYFEWVNHFGHICIQINV